MKVHFTSATLLALMSMSSNTDAFTSITIAKLRVASSLAVGSNDNEDFIKALSGGSAGSDDDTEKEDSPGGSKFKELLAQAKQGTQAPVRAIENPFLTQQQSPPAMPANPDEMSVEEQARMFREMMQQPSTPQAIPTPQRVAKTDMAGRPVGRNRDADTIANTADLYFAQLKRDSTVRNLARMRGDDESAQKVFEDEGVRELEGLLQTNPYLKGQREKEESLFDTVPEEMLKSFFDAEPSEEEKSTSGVSYKELLKQRRQKKAPQPTTQPEAVATETPVAQTPPSLMETPAVQTPPSKASVDPTPTPSVAEAVASTVVEKESKSSEPVGPEEGRKMIRTLMGLLLKHRGGPGFGKGRLQGPQIDEFSELLHDVTSLLREEAAQTTASSDPDPPMMTQAPVSETVPQPPAVTLPAPTPAPVGSPSLDSMIACVEGAITMYKNSPAELKSSVLITLRAALASAINALDSVLSVEAAIPGPAAQIDGTLIVIEGAVGMYKNSPPELKDSVLVTLRAALMSAVATCDMQVGGQPTTIVPPPAPAASTPAAPIPAVPSDSVEQAPLVDPNSKRLDEIYTKLTDAAGDGRLGLKSDMTSAEASSLADELVEMRGILMEELDSGIPDPESATTTKRSTPSAEPKGESDGGTSMTSKYQQMLAKAKASKGVA